MLRVRSIWFWLPYFIAECRVWMWKVSAPGLSSSSKQNFFLSSFYAITLSKCQGCKQQLRKKCKYWSDPWHKNVAQRCRISFYAFSNNSCSHWPGLQVIQWDCLYSIRVTGYRPVIPQNFLQILIIRALYSSLKFFKYLSVMQHGIKCDVCNLVSPGWFW